ncbi:uncharacterized protein LOC111871707 isoform X3 [Cryptotermes secundus]|uniref:uncharacterized protein LOC111871707 isoform X3 n=1 Tax=Cryptotermes secundus TaxID=105785 RepID=UPI000CD7BB24|nr:uncharacterized protein LOC111871707 isoform X3 [Cryptotermes secundus]
MKAHIPMLKWTAAYKKAAGVKRSPSAGAGGGAGGGTGSGPCYSIRRAAAKLHLSRKRNRKPSVPGFNPQQDNSQQCNQSFDKENRTRDQNKQHGSMSPRTRDSVYMRLDAIPAALRDVSNHYQTSPAGTSPAPPVVTRNKSRPRKFPSVRYPNGADVGETVNVSQEHSLEAFPVRPHSCMSCQEEESSEFRIRSADFPLSPGTTGDRLSHTPAYNNTSGTRTHSTLHIEYSPCPIRTTRSLVALRRRVTEVFVQSYHSVGTLHHPQKSHDNPIYFALAQHRSLPYPISLNTETNSDFTNRDLENSPHGRCADGVPFKLRRKDPSLCFTEEVNGTDKDKEKGHTNLEDMSGPKEPLSNNFPLSPLSRNMASLRLSSGPRDCSLLPPAPRITPPSPFLNSTTFVSNLISTSQNQLAQVHNHDVTDPRFLSYYSILSSAGVPVKTSEPNTISCSSERNQESPHTPTTQGPVKRVLCYPEESPVKKTDASQEVDRELTKRPSLRRARTGTSNSEEGPPVKVQSIVPSSGHLRASYHESKPISEEREAYYRSSSPNVRTARRSVKINRSRNSLRRSSNLIGREDKDAELKGAGRRVLASDNAVCDSTCSDEKSPYFDLYPEEESMLRRQGGFRRRQRSVFRSAVTSDSCLLNIPDRIRDKFPGLTLPNGIPSPFSPQDTSIWWSRDHQVSISDNSKTCDMSCHLVGLPEADSLRTSSHQDIFRPTSSNMIGPVNGCSDMRPRFGLTLSKGIPSPPSPSNGDDDQYCSSVGIAGIQPLSTSPVPPADNSVVMCRQKKGTTDENSSPFSDDTWNSHNHQFVKMPRFADGQLLKGATPVRGECDMEDEQLDSSSAPPVDPSPMALVERRSRSRRCLLFASPSGAPKARRIAAVRSTSWRMPRDSCHYRGELTLSVYGNGCRLTIHVISGRNLQKAGGKPCNAYVKVTLVPTNEERTFHRTSVHRESSAPWFDQKFSFEVLPTDIDKRVFVSAWHRDKEKRRSEFLGCMSFALKHAVKKDISGTFRLLSQSAGRTQHVSVDPTGGPGSKHSVMARQSDSSVEEIVCTHEPDVSPTPAMEQRKNSTKKRLERTETGNDDSSFLRHLELEPTGDSGPGRVLGPAVGPKRGRTPFTTTRRLTRHGNSGFGFSIAWTQPPRVERVEAGQPADRAGLRPGDYVIFVEKCNVVTMPEEEILHLIRSCGNHLTLEVYRRVSPNGLVGGSTTAPPCSSTTSLDLSKRRLHLPQVTFSSEVLFQSDPVSREEARRRAVYQLLNKEQQYSLCLQFGLSRFLVPLSERRDLLNASEHYTLFQNAEELLRLTEDTLEQLIHDDAEPYGQSLGRIYLAKMPSMAVAYCRYLSGLKKADCLLAAKTRNHEFMRLIVEPPVPRRRPDLTAFIHKPLEHYRDVLKLLQTILNYTKVKDEDYSALLSVVQELQTTYRDATMGSGLMEPEGEGRPLLSLQDLESRLVFTRCKPFVLSSPGRHWIFGGDLSRVEGRAVRPFWALLFTDLIVFAKVSRDRVLFITEEPLSLLSVTQAVFNIRKKANEFRLLIEGGAEGTESPAPGGCGPELPLTRNPKRSSRRRTICLRAPTAELKAVWQMLIQRQIIYLNTTRGGTPASSPMDSPDPPTTLSVATLDSFSLRRQTPMPDCKSLGNSQRHLDELIEHRCRQLGKSGASKGSALHLAQWIRGQLGGAAMTPDEEPEPEIWSPETLRRRSEQLQLMGVRSESRCEEFELSDTERSQSRSTERSRSQTSSDSQVTVRSGGLEKRVSVCRQCHKTCLSNSSLMQQQVTADNNNGLGLDEDDDECNDNWGPLILMGISALNASVGLTKSSADPFSPTEVPLISVLPPTPDTTPRNSDFQWDDSDLNSPPVEATPLSDITSQREDDDDEDDSVDQEPPYQSLTSPGGMKRYGTLASLEMLDDTNQVAEDSTDSEDHGEWDSDIDEGECSKKQESSGPPHLEVVTQSLRGWTVRAGSFVAEKMALFERLGEDSRAAMFLDRYLRPTADTQQQPVCGDSPPDPNTTSSGDECSTSAATSGEEVWGTPTSGGELDEELVFPSAVLQESPADSTSSAGVGDDDTELMMDELLATPPLSSSARGFPPRRRLEPLPEEEDTDSPTQTPAPVIEKETPSPEQGSESGGVADNYHRAPVDNQQQQQGPGFFNRLRLRRWREEPHRVKNSRLLGFLSGRRSTEDGTGGRPLFRLFNRDTVDDIPTTLPRQLTPRRQNGKQLERRFWKQLKRRRSGANALLSSPPKVAA